MIIWLYFRNLSLIIFIKTHVIQTPLNRVYQIFMHKNILRTFQLLKRIILFKFFRFNLFEFFSLKLMQIKSI